jgi:hypothetical protein
MEYRMQNSQYSIAFNFCHASLCRLLPCQKSKDLAEHVK